jgi:hypothetical protein
MPIDFKGREAQWSQSCAREQKNYEMNKCLSLVHLITGTGLNQAVWIGRIQGSEAPKLGVNSADTKSFSGRVGLLAAAACHKGP